MVLGVYKSDFYAGNPAVTCHTYCGGTAYYIACRTDDAYLNSLYSKILKDNGIKPIIEQFDENVSVTSRGEKVFIMNFSDKESVAVKNGNNIKLKPYECVIEHKD